LRISFLGDKQSLLGVPLYFNPGESMAFNEQPLPKGSFYQTEERGVFMGLFQDKADKLFDAIEKEVVAKEAELARAEEQIRKTQGRGFDGLNRRE